MLTEDQSPDLRANSTSAWRRLASLGGGLFGSTSSIFVGNQPRRPRATRACSIDRNSSLQLSSDPRLDLALIEYVGISVPSWSAPRAAMATAHLPSRH